MLTSSPKVRLSTTAAAKKIARARGARQNALLIQDMLGLDNYVHKIRDNDGSEILVDKDRIMIKTSQPEGVEQRGWDVIYGYVFALPEPITGIISLVMFSPRLSDAGETEFTVTPLPVWYNNCATNCGPRQIDAPSSGDKYDNISDAFTSYPSTTQKYSVMERANTAYYLDLNIYYAVTQQNMKSHQNGKLIVHVASPDMAWTTNMSAYRYGRLFGAKMVFAGRQFDLQPLLDIMYTANLNPDYEAYENDAQFAGTAYYSAEEKAFFVRCAFTCVFGDWTNGVQARFAWMEYKYSPEKATIELVYKSANSVTVGASIETYNDPRGIMFSSINKNEVYIGTTGDVSGVVCVYLDKSINGVDRWESVNRPPVFEVLSPYSYPYIETDISGNSIVQEAIYMSLGWLTNYSPTAAPYPDSVLVKNTGSSSVPAVIDNPSLLEYPWVMHAAGQTAARVFSKHYAFGGGSASQTPICSVDSPAVATVGDESFSYTAIHRIDHCATAVEVVYHADTVTPAGGFIATRAINRPCNSDNSVRGRTDTETQMSIHSTLLSAMTAYTGLTQSGIESFFTSNPLAILGGGSHIIKSDTPYDLSSEWIRP